MQFIWETVLPYTESNQSVPEIQEDLKCRSQNFYATVRDYIFLILLEQTYNEFLINLVLFHLALFFLSSLARLFHYPRNVTKYHAPPPHTARACNVKYKMKPNLSFIRRNGASRDLRRLLSVLIDNSSVINVDGDANFFVDFCSSSNKIFLFFFKSSQVVSSTFAMFHVCLIEHKRDGLQWIDEM